VEDQEMAEEKHVGCVAPAGGPITPKSEDQAPQAGGDHAEGAKMSVMVGKEAPDFETSAFHEGEFKNVKLSAFRGKWVFLCFYPGDFTFV
jgi:peroxiredoxin (alkyl hydroperoxide reductase subunit C)